MSPGPGSEDFYAPQAILITNGEIRLPGGKITFGAIVLGVRPGSFMGRARLRRLGYALTWGKAVALVKWRQP